jgi:hypothetical protein
MNQILIKLSLFFVLTFIIFNNVVISNENDENSEEFDEYEDESNGNFTESNGNFTESDSSLNSTDDGEGLTDEEAEEEEETDSQQTFIQKLQQLHDEGKDLTISKNVKHINDTFNTLTNLRKVINFLFPTNERTGIEALEFISGIDIGLSHECLRNVIKVLSSIRKGDLWALKCKY